MKKDFHVMYVLDGVEGNFQSKGYFKALHELMKIYFKAIGKKFINCYAEEQWVAKILQERKSYDLVVVNEKSAKDVVRAAKENAEFQSMIIVIHNRQRDLRTGKLKKFRNHWSKNVLHLREWTNFQELCFLLDCKMGYIYQKEMKEIISI